MHSDQTPPTMSSTARDSKRRNKGTKRMEEEELLAMRSKFKILIYLLESNLPQLSLIFSVYHRVLRTTVFMDRKFMLLSSGSV